MIVDLFYAETLPMPFARAAELLELTWKHVHSYETADSENVFEDAFARFNRGSGAEDAALATKQLRSLSVGDVVQVRGTKIAAICAATGWLPVDPLEVPE